MRLPGVFSEGVAAGGAVGQVQRWGLLEDQHGDFVLAQADDQLRGGLLVEVDELGAEQGVAGAGQLRHVEREGNSAFEPGLDGVAIGGDDIVRRGGAGQSVDVQVGDLAEGVGCGATLPDEGDDEQGCQGCGCGEKIHQPGAAWRCRRDLALDAAFEVGAGDEAGAGGGEQATGAEERGGFGGAGGAGAEMLFQRGCLIGREFAVKIGAEGQAVLVADLLVAIHERTSFWSVSLKSLRARARRDITVPMGMSRMPAISR